MHLLILRKAPKPSRRLFLTNSSGLRPTTWSQVRLRQNHTPPPSPPPNSPQSPRSWVTTSLAPVGCPLPLSAWPLVSVFTRPAHTAAGSRPPSRRPLGPGAPRVPGPQEPVPPPPQPRRTTPLLPMSSGPNPNHPWAQSHPHIAGPGSQEPPRAWAGHPRELASLIPPPRGPQFRLLG